MEGEKQRGLTIRCELGDWSLRSKKEAAPRGRKYESEDADNVENEVPEDD